MSWQNALVEYAKTPDPSEKLAKDVYLTHTERTLTIYDKFPKAMFHFLCLPRLPYREPQSETEIPATTLNSLSALVSHKHALKVLRDLKEASQEVVELIEEEMLAKENFTWPISVGFHPIESMSHVHLHIISQDFVSPALKNKKHWNSFNPGHGFFMHLDKLIDWLESGTLAKNNKSKSKYEQFLKDPLQCYVCDETFSTIPKLKEHLEADFARRKKQKLASTGGRSGSSKKRRGEESHSEGRLRDEPNSRVDKAKGPKQPRTASPDPQSSGSDTEESE